MMQRLWLTAVALIALSACTPTKEALLQIDVEVALEVPPVASIHFSVTGRPDLKPRDYGKDPRPNVLNFGYYVAASGTLEVLAQARNVAGCTIGEGRKTIAGIVAGEKTPVVTLRITALPAPVCTADGGVDGKTDAPSVDGRSDAPDAAPDAGADVPPKLGRGEACTADGQCALGHCVDSVCCESTCLGTCESCGEDGQKGTCVAVTGAPRGTVRPRCAGNGTACAGTCDGDNRTSCAYPDEKTVCGPAQCMSGMGAGTRSCDRAGACREAPAVACGSGMCESATKCTNGCDSGSAAAACPGTHFCNAAGACEPKVTNGGACSTDAHCMSGSCIDGRCCTVTCAPCQACTGTGGTCAPIMGRDDPGSCAVDRTCDASGVCKTRPGKMCTTGAECSGGNCVDGRCCNSAACGTCEACIGGGGDCVPVTGADDSDSCMATRSCDVSGACKLKLGEACTSASDCLQGYCVDGVCCESACSGSCEACGEVDRKGTCVAVMGLPRGDRPRCAGNATACGGMCDGTNRTTCGFPGSATTCGMSACTNGMATPAPTCDGAGGCKTWTPVPCTLGACASTTMCQGGCSATVPCPATHFCTTAGACQPKIANGMSCAADSECTSAHCVDQRCCGVAGCASCEACTGAAGTCVKVMNVDDPNSCANGTCDAAGACKAKPGQTCAADGDCITGHCVDMRCCMTAACGACQACTGGGGACVNVMGVDDDLCNGTRTCSSAGACKTKRGEACSVKEDCITDNCVDGVCCESACAGQCEACGETGNKGTCVTVSGAPRSVPYRTACSGTGTCAGTCSGTNRTACAYLGTATMCGNPTCSGGIAAPAPTCDGLGGCRPGMSVSCNSNLCANAMMCAGACNPTTAPCPTTQYCNQAGACVAKIAAGGAGCTADNQCATDHCVDSRCCAAATCGTCQSCTGTGGTCVAVTNAEDPDSTCSGARTCDSTGACKNKPGEACTAGSQCTTGSCVDGRCCTTSTCGTCRACTGGGGTCVLLTSVEDPDGNCSGSQICDSSGVCKTKQGQTCSVGGDCVTGQCADQRCCNSACNGTCQSCANTAGSCGTVTSGDDDTCTGTRTCVAGGMCKLKAGETCSGAGDCSTGNCVNSRCCTVSGCPTCQQCGPAGTCVAVTNGTPCTPGNMCSNGACVPNSGCGTGTIALGCACSGSPALACNGSAQKLKLICSGGMWAANGTCGASDNCNSLTGDCAPILPGCAGQSAGFAYCDFASPPPAYMDRRKTCGPDLVTNATTETCAGICTAGVCQGSVCGDGKIGTGETCDDGNAVALDGCEPVTAFPASTRCQPSQILKVTAGDGHTCALGRGGFVRCWGENANGELGLGHQTFMADRHPFQTTTASNGAGMVNFGGTAAIDIDAGFGFTCAILNGGSVRCWGKNDFGQLGLGNTTPMPTTVGAAVNLGGSTAIAIDAGLGFACATLANGSVRCWGDNSFSLLGQGNTDPAVLIANVALSPTSATAAIAGQDNACALVTGGGVRCWGDNGIGEFGLGNSATLTDSFTTPPSGYGNASLSAGRTAVSIATGSAFVCARLDNNQMECWGANGVGQLGLGHTTTIGDNEVPGNQGLVPIATPVTAIAAGTQFACGLVGNGGGLKCWGNNQKAQLGQGDVTRRGNTATTTPNNFAFIKFPVGLTPTAVAAGAVHACAQLSDGSLRCWGWNNRGQLGLGMVTAAPNDFIGGTTAQTPDLLAAVRVFQ